MKKVKLLLAMLGLICLGLMSNNARATILWDSGGYEADTATPDGSGDYDPADHVISRPSWDVGYITESNETYVQVFDTNSTSYAPDAKYGSNYLKLTTGSANSMEELWLGSASENFYHTFTVYCRSYSGTLKIQYGNRISQTTNIGALNLQWIKKNDNESYIQQAINGWTTIATVDNNKWVDYAIQLNYDSGSGKFTTYDFYVDGVKILDDAPLNNTSQTRINNIALYTDGASDVVFVDEHLVQTGQVPEPATIGLIVIGGLGLLRRR